MSRRSLFKELPHGERSALLDRIQQLVRTLGVAPAAVAAGISVRSVAAYKLGESEIGFIAAGRLARAAGVTLDWLFDGAEREDATLEPVLIEVDVSSAGIVAAKARLHAVNNAARRVCEMAAGLPEHREELDLLRARIEQFTDEALELLEPTPKEDHGTGRCNPCDEVRGDCRESAAVGTLPRSAQSGAMPDIFECGCSRHKVAAGRCDLFDELGQERGA